MKKTSEELLYEAEAQTENRACTFIEHDCYHENSCYFLQPIMTGRMCMVCDLITNATYRSLWMRILAVFKADEWWDNKFRAAPPESED